MEFNVRALTRRFLSKSKKDTTAFKKSADNRIMGQVYQVAYSTLSTIALIPATIAYEQSYNPRRQPEICATGFDGLYYDWISFTISIIAILLIGPYLYYKKQWINSMRKVRKILARQKGVDYKPVNKFRALITSRIVFDFISMLLMPYPMLDWKIYIPQQNNFKSLSVCYYVNEILYALMFIRILTFYKAIVNYSIYTDEIALQHGEQHKTRITTLFAVKCFIHKSPLTTLNCFFVAPSIFFFAMLLRIFERPMGEQGQDYNSVINSIWNIIITQTTVGFGDFAPVTVLGRFICAISAFWGGIILTLAFVTVQTQLIISPNEFKTYNSISKSRSAVRLIEGAYLSHRLKYRKDSSQIEMHPLITNFRKVRGSQRIDGKNRAYGGKNADYGSKAESNA